MDERVRIINIIDETKEFWYKKAMDKNDKDAGCFDKLELLEDIKNKIYDTGYEPKLSSLDGLQDAIDYYRTNMVFRLNEEDKENIEKIIKYMHRINDLMGFYSGVASKFSQKNAEQEEIIKCMKQDLRYSIPVGTLNDKIRRLEKSKIKERNNDIIDLKIRLIKDLLKEGKGQHTSKLLKM